MADDGSVSTDDAREAPAHRYARLDRATGSRAAPLAVVDLDAFDRNADALVARAGGAPIRLATKSVRCRHLIAAALERPGVEGLLAFSLREALWLAGTDVGGDILVAYPCVDVAALRELAADARARERIALVVDAPEHLGLIGSAVRAVAPGQRGPVRVWLDVDCSLRVASAHLGARRSPLHTVSEVVAAARAVAADPHVSLGGLMFYDAQIAGLPDAGVARLPVHLMQRASAAELARRRGAILAAVREIVEVPAVNAGGTGSLHLMGGAAGVTEVAAGSGLFGPTLFDGYRAFTLEPAACFALDVVRRPAPGFVTAFGGGYVASGAPGRSRLPTPVWPPGLRLLGSEGAGEVQTPLRVTGSGRGGVGPAIGSRVWLRHTKAGEMLERFGHVHLVRGERVVATVPSYRGEGLDFG